MLSNIKNELYEKFKKEVNFYIEYAHDLTKEYEMVLLSCLDN